LSDDRRNRKDANFHPSSPTDVIEAFDKIAKALDRDRTWVMV
jgi:hypothetical protein